jgi:hypothetical protein
LESKVAQAEAVMKKRESKVLLLEYGPYQKNYAIHLTPINPHRNLSTEASVKRACMDTVVVLNDYVPHTCRVDLFLPKTEWKMKVISAVVVGGADLWNFNTDQFEAEGIPRIFSAVEKIILAS